MKNFTRLFLCLLFATLSNFASAQNTILLDSTILVEREVATGIQIPWEILWGPDDHIWVTERRGRVLRIDPANGNTNTILNIQNLVASGSEAGLLGMALHPHFMDTAKVYLVYTYIEGGFNIKERLVSYDWTGSNLVNETILLNDLNGGNIHDGSRLLVTPDGKLLMTTGDVGVSSHSQNINSLNGKLLRINLDGSIPSDNPFPGRYLYSIGHRNSQGLAYGPGGRLYSSEHGAQQSDEFNLIEPQRNYGWPNVQGACNTVSEINFCNINNVMEPLVEWSPCVAVNGIAYYDHPGIPEWQGKMLLAVLGGFVHQPRLSVLEFNASGTAVLSETQYFTNYGRIRDVCVNPHNGAIYFATNGNSYPGSGPNRIVEYRNPNSFATSIQDPVSLDQYIRLIPNPAEAEKGCTVEFSPNFVGHDFELIHFNGSVVIQQNIKSPQTRLDLRELAAGNYYLKATNKKGTITQKLIIR